METTAEACLPGDGVATATSLNPNRALLAICLADLGAMTSFYLLFPVVPLHAAAAAGAGAAGLVTGALMLATVVAELAMPSLAARFGYRQLFCAGLVLLGLPALVLAASSNLLAILAVSLLRGVGLGILLVAGSSLVAAIMPAGRRAEGLGIYGVASGVPAIVALPLGPWLAAHFGTAPVFVCGGLAALCGLAAMIELPRNTPRPAAAIGIIAGLAMPALMRPALALVFSRDGCRHRHDVPAADVPQRIRRADRAGAAGACRSVDARPLARRTLWRQPGRAEFADRRHGRRRPRHHRAGLCRRRGRADDRHAAGRRRIRHGAECQPVADVRKGAGVGLRHGERHLEPCL